MSRRHTYENHTRLGDIREDIGGVCQNKPPLGVYVDQKSLVFPGLTLDYNTVDDEKR